MDSSHTQAGFMRGLPEHTMLSAQRSVTCEDERQGPTFSVARKLGEAGGLAAAAPPASSWSSAAGDASTGTPAADQARKPPSSTATLQRNVKVVCPSSPCWRAV